MAWIICVVVVQVILNLIYLRYVNKHMRQALNAVEIKREIEALIMSFNRNADKQITVLDDRLSQVKSLMGNEFVQKKSNNKKEVRAKEKDIHAYSEINPGSEESSESMKAVKAQIKQAIKKNSKNKKKSKPTQLDFLNTVKSSDVKTMQEVSLDHSENALRYFEQKKIEHFEEMTLTEKISFLKEKDVSKEKIAERLDLSLTEVNYFLTRR